PTGTQPSQVVVVGRLKLVNPPEAQLVRGEDALFRTRDGNAADADVAVTVTSGSLEGSNVNMVESMVSMISLARQFDTQMKLLQTANENSRRASSVLAING
ncbi:MAG: flagellar basal body rod C-terminal domain-containing protein, partial [Gallionellaceae bacterium]|nr:flagellar basal body rod C-terminal domain-containing protein [Gallionellaceae bacterium]